MNEVKNNDLIKTKKTLQQFYVYWQSEFINEGGEFENNSSNMYIQELELKSIKKNLRLFYLWT